MSSKVTITLICLLSILSTNLLAQNHSSVHLENQVYYILEQAEMRGLCSPLSGIRPYTRSAVLAKISEILAAENGKKLNAAEREILQQYADDFSAPKQGIDWMRGAYYNETSIGKNDAPLSVDIGIAADVSVSAGMYSSGDNYSGAEIWVGAHMKGDLGHNVSYNFIFEGGLMKAPRRFLGTYNTYYEGFPKEDETDSEYANRVIDILSEPLTHFPYTYQKRWDGSVYFFSKLSHFEDWPDSFAGGYNLPAELTGSFLENKVIARLGRITHEWGSMPFGSSLAFNQMARPFLGIELEFNPVSWFGFASLTGVLEYYNKEGIYVSPWTSQNAFSITMLEFRYKNYFFLDFIDAVIWPKRFDLGYISPITNNFFYQNNTGKFDNMAITINLKAQYPGLGNIWFSLFVDEMNLTSDLLTLDRQMFAMQGGAHVSLPFLSFSSLQLSYTRINPYNYTHHRNYLPWYGDNRMEKAYTNNGVSLGHYLPPNSDEILIRLKTMPINNINAHLQYQLIRHGADFGPSAVDGSNLLSELDPENRDNNLVLKRFFLQDGAYQWMNIVKVGAEWSLNGLPITLFGEAGLVVSFFTNIAEDANVTGKAHPYSVIDTEMYPKSTAFIAKFGVKVFSR
ncbi:MAG: hypothetical protein FWG46_01240 [Treponema sp.]|nr:hypothetical protein [Treponema sp.]